MSIVIKDVMVVVFVTTIKNISSDLCNKSKCTIFMAVINVFYNYKCSHICSCIFHILL
jgi:hypothetical protein